MIINSPLPADIPALRQLWQQAFGDTDAFLDGFFRTGFTFQRCRCVKLEKQLVAGLYWFDCRWEDKKIAYLYAVATHRNFRGQGLCRALMEDTHRHLESLGYAGAVLVPGNKALFSLYENLGYTPFCPMQTVTALPEALPADIRPISADTYFSLRQQMLPASSVALEKEAHYFAATFCRFYRGDHMLMCLNQENDTLYFQEYLGDGKHLAAVVTALGAKKGFAHLPGGDQPFAMHLLFDSCGAAPEYFNIALN